MFVAKLSKGYCIPRLPLGTNFFSSPFYSFVNNSKSYLCTKATN